MSFPPHHQQQYCLKHILRPVIHANDINPVSMSIDNSMDTSKPTLRQSASRSPLRNVSNGQFVTNGGSTSVRPEKTPDRGSTQIEYAKATSSINSTQAARRQLTRPHGDLSKLRPKSPPLSLLPEATDEFHLSLRNFAGGSKNTYSPRHNRPIRQAIPNEWLTEPKDPESNAASCPSMLSGYEGQTPGCHPFAAGQQRDQGIEKSPIISIQGLGSGITQPLDFLVPAVRRYPANAGQGHVNHGLTVEHTSSTTIWSVSQYEEAQKLYRIHQAFTAALERVLASELWKIYRCQDGISDVGHNESLFTSGIVRGVSFCSDQLVEEMAASLHGPKAKAQLGLVRLYLAASDCLFPCESHPRDTSIMVRVFCDHKSRIPIPIVEAVWVPDSIVFEGLEGSIREGERFSLNPRYQNNSAFRSNRFPSDIRYSIGSHRTPLSWLLWDEVSAGFQGIVPFFSEVDKSKEYSDSINARHQPYPGHPKYYQSLHIDVKATLSDGDGSSIKYERSVCARVTLTILPAFSPKDGRPSTGLKQDTAYGASKYRPGYRGSARRTPQVLDSSISQPSCDVSTSISGAHFNPLFSSAGVNGKVSKSSHLAQKHADLAAYYADLAQRHAEAETQVMMLGSTRYDHTYQRVPSNDLRSYSIPQYYSEPGLISRSLYMTTTSQTPPVNPAYNANFSSLAPSTYRSIPSQTFNEEVQAWTRTQTPQGTSNSRDQASRFRDTGSSQHGQHTISQRAAKTPRLHAAALHKSPVRYNSQEDTADPDNASIIATATSSNYQDLTSTQGRLKRRATSDPSSSISDFGEEAETLTQRDMVPPNTVYQAQPVQVQPMGPTRRFQNVQDNSVYRYPAQGNIPSARTVSTYTWRSKGTDSRVPSSNLAVTVENSLTASNRRDQARVWSQLSNPEYRDKENRSEHTPMEPRLSQDERKVTEDALERSFDDMHGGFNEIFLSDSGDSSANDEDDPEQ